MGFSLNFPAQEKQEKEHPPLTAAGLTSGVFLYKIMAIFRYSPRRGQDRRVSGTGHDTVFGYFLIPARERMRAPEAAGFDKDMLWWGGSIR